MQKIKKFRINKNNDSLENIKEIKRNVENFCEQKHIINLNSGLSKILDIPDKVLLKKTKQIVYRCFDFEDRNPRFKINLNIFDTLKYTIFFLIFCFYQKKISQKKIKRQKFDLILDNVSENIILEKFSNLLTFFKKSLILTNKNVLKKTTKKENYKLINEHFSLFSNEILKNKKKELFTFLIRLLLLSTRLNLNLLKIYFIIFYTSLKYYKIFKIYESDVLIFDRIYHTCPLRNFLFKKNGGKKILCVQSHLAEGSISVFSDIDILVTFGKEKDTRKKLEMLGGKINDSFSCGSLLMEYRLKDDLICNALEPIDILFVGLNPYSWLHTSKEIPKIYYEQMQWIVEISKRYPNLNILYKHHTNFKGDPIERKIFKSSRIPTIIKPEENLNSYNFLVKSKLILSFGSTMILEGISLGKDCYFLDPELKNSIFFENLDYLKDYRISNFKELDKIVSKLAEKPRKKLQEINDNCCLSHNKASERIFKYISSCQKISQ